MIEFILFAVCRAILFAMCGFILVAVCGFLLFVVNTCILVTAVILNICQFFYSKWCPLWATVLTFAISCLALCHVIIFHLISFHLILSYPTPSVLILSHPMSCHVWKLSEESHRCQQFSVRKLKKMIVK